MLAYSNGGIEHGMLRATARIWFETQLVTTECPSQTFGELYCVITVRLVELEETELAQEDVMRTRETLAGQ
ncbi:MAG: hypothetical protein JOY91_09355 [Sinobacteraceae bacterium]|nr:hypothetical protein [Nevskiaceae bacterium]